MDRAHVTRTVGKVGPRAFDQGASRRHLRDAITPRCDVCRPTTRLNVLTGWFAARQTLQRSRSAPQPDGDLMDTNVQDVPGKRTAPRAELEEMTRRWIEAHDRATATGDWKSNLGAFYTDDAEYRWDLGPDETFLARGLTQIREIGVGYQMEGFERWSYPYERTVIDETKQEMVGFWRQISPYKRPDGTPYQVAGLGVSWFRYAGDFKWSQQQDFLDLASVVATMRDLAAAGLLPPALKKKMQLRARGQLMEGLTLRPERTSAAHKLRGNLALGRIALLGR
jgi:hypothetical protein